MTTFLAKLWHRLQGQRAVPSIMLIGLDNSGKTSILESLKSVPSLSPGAGSPEALADVCLQDPCRIHRRQVRCCPANQRDRCTLCDQHRAQLETGPDAPGMGFSPKQPASCGPYAWDVPSPIETDAGASQLVEPTVGYSYEKINCGGYLLNVLDFSGQSKYRGLWHEFLDCVDAIVFVIDSSDLLRLVVVRDELETLLANPYFASLQPAGPTAGAGASPIGGTCGAGAGQAQGLEARAPAVQQKQITISQGKLMLAPLEGASAPRGARQAAGPISSLTIGVGGGFKRTSAGRTRVPLLLLAHKTDLSTSVDTAAVTRALNLDQLINKSRHPWRVQATSVNEDHAGLVEAFNWLLGAMCGLP